MTLAGKKVMISGAGGFIGSHLTELLISLDCDVTAFVHYNSLNRWGWLDTINIEQKTKIHIFSGDIRDPNGVRTAMKDAEVVFHLAALIGIPYSYHSPDSYVDTNVKGTLNILQAARDLGVQRIIHTSTSEVYGTAQQVPISEEHPVNPQSPYAATKAGADFLALTFYRSFGTPVVVARPFNTYGPRQSARAVIPSIIIQILRGTKMINLGDVTPTRDFNYIEDACRGFIALAESDAALGEVVNIGSNFEISVRDTFQLINTLMDGHSTIVHDPQRIRPKQSEVFRLWCDNKKILHLTGFKPEYSLENGLKKTIAWYRTSEYLKEFKGTIYNV